MKNINWDEAFLIRPNRKPLSFPGSGKLMKEWDSETKKGNFIYMDDYESIEVILSRLPEYGKKIIIIDDSTHLMTEEFMSKIDQKGLIDSPLAMAT